MNTSTSDSISRRTFVRQTSTLAAAALLSEIGSTRADDPKVPHPAPRPFLTPANDFGDVSRGDPKPFKLVGAAQAEARLTAETWRLEITADPFVEAPFIKVPATLNQPRTIADGTALDFAALLELGKKHEVSFIKAMQCLNISAPLGQGVWTGVPLREVLRACGKMNNVRRIYYWGYHNHDPKQVFKSSVSYSEAFETPPDELPVILAYRLNGAPLSPERGGPVRMIVPWSHGFKSIKWLQHIFLTNDYRTSDTYATQNNDPESFLKTAAYLDKGPEQIKAGEAVTIGGHVIVGRSGLKRVEYWVRAVEAASPALSDDDHEALRGPWLPCELQTQPEWNKILPPGLEPKKVLGFDPATGAPRTWPLRDTMLSFSAAIHDLKPGHYEIRARSVDLNDFAQPEPRPAQKTGKNALLVRKVEIL